MLRSHPKRPDWFVVPIEEVKHLGAVPLMRGYNETCVEVPRSILPLWEEGRAYLAAERAKIDVGFNERCAVRDASTSARGYTLRPHQHVGVEFVGMRRGTLIADSMRTGKAGSLETPVLTPSGWKRMGDLRLGDEVVDPDGGVGIVEGIFPQGIRPMYRVTTCDGASTECDADHLWLLYTATQRMNGGAGRVFALKDFKDNLRAEPCGEYAPGKPRRQGNHRWFLPLCVPPVFSSTSPLPLDPYVLGVLLGDGSLTGGTARFTKGDPELAKCVAARLPATLRVVQIKPIEYEIRPTVKHSRENAAVSAIAQLRLNCLAVDKFIPPIYLRASVGDRKALLAGLMDTDGDSPTSSKTTTLTFNTSSPRLCADVRELVESLGGFAGVTDRVPHYSYQGERLEGARAYRLHIRCPFNPFTLPSKASAWRGAGPMARSIDSVEYIGDKPAQCIAVSTKRNLYVTDHYIVTHNTCMSLNTHDPATGKLVVIAPLPTREVWRGWINRVFPDTEVSVITGKTFDRAKLQAPIILGHYDIMGAWQDTSLKIGTLILDEAHILSNRRSGRTKQAAFLATRSEKILPLTGTPLWNKPQSLWPLLGLAAPGQFGAFHDFAIRYTKATPSAFGWKYEDTAYEDELKARLTEVMLHRRWEDIAQDLPPITRDTLIVDLTPEQRLDVDIAAEAARSDASAGSTIGGIAKYRSTLSRIKIGPAIEAARGDLDRGERVVMWFWHKNSAKQAYDALRKKYSAFLITGAVNPAKREAILNEWKATPGSCLVITIAVGQVGIDLSASHLAIFAEVDFTPALIAQAEMRTFSPLRSMNVRYLVVDHPIEHAIIDALRAKLDNSGKIGVPAAEAAIDVLKNAFSLPEEEGDMARLLRDLLSSVDDDG